MNFGYIIKKMELVAFLKSLYLGLNICVEALKIFSCIAKNCNCI